jgi:hypothetical protein
MFLTDDEQKKLLESTGRITGRVSKAVTDALRALGLGAVPADINKVYRLAEKLDKRQEQLVKAELRSLAARSATFRSNVDD